MKPISCEKVRNYVDAIPTSEWTLEWREWIALHSDRCEECRLVVAGAELLDASLRTSAETAPPARMAASILERTERIAQSRKLELPADAKTKKSLSASIASTGIWRPIAWAAIGIAVLVVSLGGVEGLLSTDLARGLAPFAGLDTGATAMWNPEATPVWQMVAALTAVVFLLSAGITSSRPE